MNWVDWLHWGLKPLLQLRFPCFPNDDFELENSRKFSKQVENAVGKGEIARYEQFFLFPQFFFKRF